jgi:outer membrane immunogenic protein
MGVSWDPVRQGSEGVMRNFGLIVSAAVAIGSIAGIGAASAADLPAATYAKAPVMVDPGYNWSGFYLGGNVGYGWGGNSDPSAIFADNNAVGFAAYSVLNPVPSVRPTGVIGGVQAGYNWAVTPNALVGLVADFQGSGVTSSATQGVTPPGFTLINLTNSEKTDWFGTVRGKLGFTQNNWLVYGTGGLAYGKVATSASFVDPTGFFGIDFAGSNSSIKTGWALGAGLDYGITPNWIVGVEYLYVDLGRISYTETSALFPASSITVSNRDTINLVRLTVDYKFGGPGVAKY